MYALAVLPYWARANYLNGRLLFGPRMVAFISNLARHYSLSQLHLCKCRRSLIIGSRRSLCSVERFYCLLLCEASLARRTMARWDRAIAANISILLCRSSAPAYRLPLYLGLGMAVSDSSVGIFSSLSPGGSAAWGVSSSSSSAGVGRGVSGSLLLLDSLVPFIAGMADFF